MERLYERTKDSKEAEDKSEPSESAQSLDFNAFKIYFKTLKRADFTNLFNLCLNVCPLEHAKGKDHFKMNVKKIEFGTKQKMLDFDSDSQYSQACADKIAEGSTAILTESQSSSARDSKSKTRGESNKSNKSNQAET